MRCECTIRTCRWFVCVCVRVYSHLRVRIFIPSVRMCVYVCDYEREEAVLISATRRSRKDAVVWPTWGACASVRPSVSVSTYLSPPPSPLVPPLLRFTLLALTLRGPCVSFSASYDPFTLSGRPTSLLNLFLLLHTRQLLTDVFNQCQAKHVQPSLYRTFRQVCATDTLIFFHPPASPPISPKVFCLFVSLPL